MAGCIYDLLSAVVKVVTAFFFLGAEGATWSISDSGTGLS